MNSDSGTLCRELSFGERPRLDFRGDLVAVRVRPLLQGDKARVQVEHVEDAGGVELDISQRGDWLLVTVRHRDALRSLVRQRLRRRWMIGCLLELPAGVEARIETEAGAVDLQQLTGDFELRSDAGQIRVSDVEGNLRLQTNAGRIECRRFRGWIEATTDAGAISLAAEALAPGTHRLRAAVGKVDVQLPSGADVRVETRSSIGRVRNDFTAADGAQALLRVETEVGAIAIRTAAVVRGADGATQHASESERQAEVLRILQQVADHVVSAEEANRRIAALH